MKEHKGEGGSKRKGERAREGKKQIIINMT